MKEEKTRIRLNLGPMPFDRADATGFGLVHATGREVLKECGAGFMVWSTEYEEDDTVDLPETDPPYEEDEEEEYDEEE